MKKIIIFVLLAFVLTLGNEYAYASETEAEIALPESLRTEEEVEATRLAAEARLVEEARLAEEAGIAIELAEATRLAAEAERRRLEELQTERIQTEKTSEELPTPETILRTVRDTGDFHIEIVRRAIQGAKQIEEQRQAKEAIRADLVGKAAIEIQAVRVAEKTIERISALMTQKNQENDEQIVQEALEATKVKNKAWKEAKALYRQAQEGAQEVFQLAQCVKGAWEAAEKKQLTSLEKINALRVDAQDILRAQQVIRDTWPRIVKVEDFDASIPLVQSQPSLGGQDFEAVGQWYLLAIQGMKEVAGEIAEARQTADAVIGAAQKALDELESAMVKNKWQKKAGGTEPSGLNFGKASCFVRVEEKVEESEDNDEDFVFLRQSLGGIHTDEDN